MKYISRARRLERNLYPRNFLLNTEIFRSNIAGFRRADVWVEEVLLFGPASLATLQHVWQPTSFVSMTN